MRHILLPAALAVFALSMIGCAPKYPKCDKDAHCKEHNEVCVNGACQECGQDADCKADFVCRETRCVPKPECASTGDCQPGFKCSAEKCVPECAADGECPGGMVCKAGRCAPEPQCDSDADCASGMRCDANQRCVEGAPVSTCNLETVLFDFNESSLTSRARATIDQNADCIKSRNLRVTLAGHADERGTEEYNLHLGERRANSVKKYLTALGVEPSQLTTVSYGEERPADTGSNEAAWARNRRVELIER